MLDYALLGTIGFFIAMYLYGTVYITYCIFRSSMFERWQKIVIVTISWLLPIVGPAFIYRLLEEEISSIKLVRFPFVTYIFLSSDATWAYGKGNHNEPHSASSDSGGGESG